MELVWSSEGLADLFRRKQKQFVAQAARIVGSRWAGDAVQDSFIKLHRHVAQGKTLSEQYVRRTIHSLAVDRWRRDRRLASLDVVAGSSSDISDSEDRVSEPSLIEFGDAFDATQSQLTEREAQVFRARAMENTPYSVICGELNCSHAAARKLFERARSKVWTQGVVDWIRQGRYHLFDSIRLNVTQACRVARRCRTDPSNVESLLSVFENRDRNDAIKNATLILSMFLPKGREGSNAVQDSLCERLEHGALYRGQKMYIADALLDANYKRHIYRVRRSFLLDLACQDDRPARRTPTRAELDDPDPVSIYDLKPVRDIGGEVTDEDTRRLLDDYVRGEGTIDYRRCLEFELLRIHQGDAEVVQRVVATLHDEEDHANACYVVNYLRRHGLRRHPQLANLATMLALESAARRFPQSAYLARSAEALNRLV